MVNRREHTRGEIFLDAILSNNRLERISMQVNNIGMGGVYLMADQLPLLTVGEELDLTININIAGQDQHIIRSKVSRIDREGIALKFMNIDVGYLTFLEKVLAYKAGKSLVA